MKNRSTIWKDIQKKLLHLVAVLALVAAAPGFASAASMQSSGASNTNDTSVSISVQNDSSTDGTSPVDNPTASISSTGPGSQSSISNDISSNTNISNENNISVTNQNSQEAKTGNCTVKYNTMGGNAVCGAAQQKEQKPPKPPVPEQPPAPQPGQNVSPTPTPSQQPKVLGAAVSAPSGGQGAGEELVNTGASTLPGIFIGMGILGTLTALTYLTTGKRRSIWRSKSAVMATSNS